MVSIASIFSSKGIKRTLVTWLAAIIEVVQVIPGGEKYILVLSQLNQALGGAAVVHAAGANTLSKYKVASAVSALYALIGLSAVFPVLLPAVPYLTKLAGLLSVARLGKEVIK